MDVTLAQNAEDGKDGGKEKGKKKKSQLGSRYQLGIPSAGVIHRVLFSMLRKSFGDVSVSTFFWGTELMEIFWAFASVELRSRGPMQGKLHTVPTKSGAKPGLVGCEPGCLPHKRICGSCTLYNRCLKKRSLDFVEMVRAITPSYTVRSTYLRIPNFSTE